LKAKGVVTICTVPAKEADSEKPRTFPGGRVLTEKEYQERHPVFEKYAKDELMVCDKCNQIHGLNCGCSD